MKKYIIIFLAIISTVSGMSCSLMHEREGNSISRADESPTEIARAIIGTWKLEAVNCDADGKGCGWYEGTRIFKFKSNSEVEVNGKKCGTYRIDGTICKLQTRTKEYAVLIRQIDKKRLITGEPFRTTTEIFRRLK